MTEQERYMTTTPFQTIYNRFLSKVTDDMYMEWTEADTHADLKNILIDAIPKFESPKFKLFDYDPDIEILDKDGLAISEGRFNFGLTQEEIAIFAELMLIEWISRQMATINLTRMNYSTSDFKQTSQANHLDKLIKMKGEYERGCRRLQQRYVRRKLNADGYFEPNFGGLGGSDNAN